MYTCIVNLFCVNLYTVNWFCVNFVQWAVYVYSIKIKIKLSSSQEPLQCLLRFNAGAWLGLGISDLDVGLSIPVHWFQRDFKFDYNIFHTCIWRMKVDFPEPSAPNKRSSNRTFDFPDWCLFCLLLPGWGPRSPAGSRLKKIL